MLKKSVNIKLASTAVAAVIAVSAFAAPAAATVTAVGDDTAVISVISANPAAADKSEGLEKAILGVKAFLNIDEAVYTEFDYYYIGSYTLPGGKTLNMWDMTWRNADYSAYISASATSEGEVLSFYRRQNSAYGFAEIDSAAAKATAAALLADILPGDYQKFTGVTVNVPSLNSNAYRIEFKMTANGYEMRDCAVNIAVDKYTGEVVEYSSNFIIYEDLIIPAAEGLIGRSAAVAAFAEKIGLELRYISRYNYETGTYGIYPVYYYSGYNQYIDAKTGQVIIPDLSGGFKGSDSVTNDIAAEAAGSADKGGLSPAEQAAVDKAANFISEDAAIKALLTAAGISANEIGDYTSRVYLYTNYYDKDKYIYQISLYNYGSLDGSGKTAYREYDPADPSTYQVNNLYGAVNAETGAVYSYNIYDNVSSYEKDGSARTAAYTYEQALAAVQNKIAQLAPSQFAQTKSADELRYGGNYGYDSAYYFSYIRMANGVPFYDNGISATFNNYSGRITSFNLNWYDSASFPSVSGAMNETKAAEAFLDACGYSLYYVMAGSDSAAIVYDLDSRKSSYIDPFTGMPVDYYGNPITETAAPDYSDVAGHWSEEIVTKLLGNGISYWSGNFNPDAAITAEEFIGFLQAGLGYRLSGLYGYYDVKYNSGYATDSVTSEIVATDSVAVSSPRAEPVATEYIGIVPVLISANASSLTRAEASKIITEALGYGKLAAMSEIFAYPFSDAVDPAYRGYITICSAFGIMNGYDGAFNPDAPVTRADAAVMLYNLINMYIVG